MYSPGRRWLRGPGSRAASADAAIATPVVDLLRAIEGQRTEHAELRWASHALAGGFVFAKLDGSPHDPEVVTKDVARCMMDARLAGIRLHDLRHTHASLLRAVGENVKVVQERLGHASITITSDIDGHVMLGMHREAAITSRNVSEAVLEGQR